MAITRDIETQVEDAFVSVLDAYSDITCTVRKWKDGSQSKSYPSMSVHCSPADHHDGTPGTSTGPIFYVCIVELMVETYQHDDESAAIAKAQLGAVRDCLAQSGIRASLDAVTGVDVTFYGILVAGGTQNIDAENVNQISLTLTCHVGL